jgi:predicted DsbA family dithiol-disulfide isomerase/uncharacterized membrane protein
MALLIDTLGVTPAYCSGATGCHAAKLAASRVLGSVPLPLIGLLAFFGLLGVTTLRSNHLVRQLQFVGALVAALCAAGLLLVQALVIKSFCPFCVVVDIAALVAAVLLVVVHRNDAGEASASWLHPVAVGGLAVVACVAPVVWPHLRPAAAVPAQLNEFAIPDRISVVEFVDFGCGHCRSLYPTIEKLRAERASRIHLVRLHAPARSHRQARDAARLLYCLGPDVARAEKLTEVLFENPALDHASIVSAAEYVGMTEEQVSACWTDASSEGSLDDNVKRLESLGFQGLPTTYVGGERIVGAMPLQIYLAALDRVQRSSGSANAELVAFYVLFGMLVLGIIVVGRRAARPQQAP